MLDFGALPPEVNSGKIYAGPGSGPMMAAAAAWDALAAELSCAATGYGSTVSELTNAGWLGPASLAMAKAVAPYVAWLHTTTVQSEQTAAQAKTAAAAYEAAFAMTVPPPVVAANRSRLVALVATNFLGQNSPAIAATEAEYLEMWLQDAAAMYRYAEFSAAAAKLNPFNPPPPTTNSVGPAAQFGAVAHATGSAAGTQHSTLSQLMSAAPAAQQHAAAATTTSSDPPSLMSTYSLGLSSTKFINTAVSGSNAGNTGRSILIANERLAFQETQAPGSHHDIIPASTVTPTPPGGGRSTVSASVGRATLVGSFSAPPSWTTEAATARPVALAVSGSCDNVAATAAAYSPPVSDNAFSQSLLGTLSRQSFDGPRAKNKPIIVRSPAAG